MELKFLGHATFLAEIDGTKVLFDPFISSNPLAKHIDIDSIKADYILISHGHLDHVEDLEQIYNNQEKCTLISNYEITAYYKKKGFAKVHPIMPGGKWKFPFGVLYGIEESHSSSMPDGTYGGVPMGFVVETQGKTFYFAGDTGLHQNMKLIPEFCNIDFAILPIGGNFTMDTEQAMIAADFVKTSTVIAMHYDTNDFIKVNKNTALEAAKRKGKEMIFMDIGQSLKF